MSEPVPLSGAEAAAWTNQATKALRALRLNKLFPPWRRVAGHLEALSDGVKLDEASGLPIPRAWIRVRMEHELAEQTLAELADTTLPELVSKRRRLTRLRSHDALPTRAIHVALRHRGDDGVASYRVTVDRLDLATATLARYSIVLADRPGSRVSQGDLELRASDAFRSHLEVLAAEDAALAFAVLAQELQVEEVVRGVLGPAVLAGRCGPTLGFEPSGPVVTACLERASVDLTEGHVDDPLARSVTLPRDAGFGLSWQRKWACPRADVPRLRAWLAERGSRNLVYGY